MQEQLATLEKEALDRISQIDNKSDIQSVKTEYLGKKGQIKAFFKQMGQVDKEERASFGQLINQTKTVIEDALEKQVQQLEQAQFTGLEDKEWIDVTAPGYSNTRGHIHPITQLQYQIEDIFRSMGFQVFDGPHMEDDYHNFEALNIPADHPARDMQDTFWLSNGRLLRTHTSAVQIRTMKQNKPPLKGISPGRVFRYEATDASHENTFYQVEGLMVDKDISVSHLIYTMKTLLKEIFQKDVKVRLRPGFFPFVEPGFELDIHCLICDGEGCSVCKRTGWVELLPCGAVHPNVLRSCDIDPEEYTGFAFGLGLDRLIMMRYGINDIRYFQSGNLKFLEQF